MTGQKPILFIHIGSDKAGSSAIQSFLNVNRKELIDKHGVLYPNLTGLAFGKGDEFNHSAWFFQLNETGFDKEKENAVKRLKRYCTRKKVTKVVLSSEALFRFLGPEMVKDLLKRLGFEYKIILYLRRQDHWIESAWKQWGHKDPRFNTIHDFERDLNADWGNILGSWLNVFEADDIILRPFEANIIGLDVVQDFLGCVGIKNKKGLVDPPPTNLNVNAGLKPEIIKILSLCKDKLSNVHDNRLLNLFSENLPEKYKKTNPFKPYGFLSPAERLQIMTKYESSNREVARIFLGDERETLFLDPLPDINEPWDGNSELTLERLVPVFMELIMCQQEQIQLLKRDTRHGLFHFPFVSGRMKKAKVLFAGTLKSLLNRFR